MENSEFHEFFVDELRHLLGRGTFAKSIIKNAKSSKELAMAFKKHTGETEQSDTGMIFLVV